MTELISKDIVDLQDIEKVQFLQALQSDPAQYSAYLADKRDRILKETVDTKRSAFVKMAGDMARQMDMDHNSRAALDRTQDLLAAQTEISKNQAGMVSATRFNDDLTRRQVEINNWYYENKRETLFVLQLVLLVGLTMVILLGVASLGFIPQKVADYLMFLVLLIGAGVWLYRWYYTSYVRDPRFWNRRTFGEDNRVAPPKADSLCRKESGETVPSSPSTS